MSDTLDESNIEKVDNELCTMCNKKTLTLMQSEMEVPFFGKVFVFSMSCNECKYRMADVEIENQNEPSRFSLEVVDEKDLNIRVIKSSTATLKIPRIITMEPGPASQGFISNVEGVINKSISVIETARDSAEDDDEKKKAKNLIKKLKKVLFGQEPIKIILEDPSGNSAIISEKAKKEKIKG